MNPEPDSPRVRTSFEIVLWLLVLVIAAAIVVFSCLALLDGRVLHQSARFQVPATCAAGVLLFAIGVLGLVLRWGPVVPTSVLTAVTCAMFFPSSLSNSAEDAIRESFVRLFWGVLLGAIIGMLINEYLIWKSAYDRNELQNF